MAVLSGRPEVVDVLPAEVAAEKRIPQARILVCRSSGSRPVQAVNERGPGRASARCVWMWRHSPGPSALMAGSDKPRGGRPERKGRCSPAVSEVPPRCPQGATAGGVAQEESQCLTRLLRRRDRVEGGN